MKRKEVNLPRAAAALAFHCVIWREKIDSCTEMAALSESRAFNRCPVSSRESNNLIQPQIPRVHFHIHNLHKCVSTSQGISSEMVSGNQASCLIHARRLNLMDHESTSHLFKSEG